MRLLTAVISLKMVLYTSERKLHLESMYVGSIQYCSQHCRLLKLQLVIATGHIYRVCNCSQSLCGMAISLDLSNKLSNIAVRSNLCNNSKLWKFLNLYMYNYYYVYNYIILLYPPLLWQ